MLKPVQFTAPTYYEPSEYDPTDDEEERDEDSQIQNEASENADDTEPHEEPTGSRSSSSGSVDHRYTTARARGQWCSDE